MTADYRILLDAPLDKNLALGFDELADAFRSVIETSPAQFAIGVFGGWGSGKTTLMQAIKSRLNPKNCAVVWFSAWRYEKEQHLIVPLLDVVREGLMDWYDANQDVPAQLGAGRQEGSGHSREGDCEPSCGILDESRCPRRPGSFLPSQQGDRAS